MKRPMMLLAAAWFTGLLLAMTQPEIKRSSILMLYGILYVVVILFLKKYPHVLKPYVQPEWYPQLTLLMFVVPCVFMAGHLRMEQVQEKKTEVRSTWINQKEAGEAYVFVRGMVTEKRCEEQVILVLSDCTLCSEDGEERMPAGACQVLVTGEGKKWLPESFIGNEIEVYGKFSLYEPAGNPGQFDAAQYYNGKGLYASVKAVRITICSDEKTILGHGMFLLKQRLRESLTTWYPAEKAGVLAAMMLGDKDLLEDEVKELYQRNGISHILAISGLHISMLCMGLFRLLRKLGVPLGASVFVAVLFLGFYICFTGASTSSLRAGMMCLVLFGAKLLRRSYDLLSSLSLAAILVTAIRPLEVRSAGFLLSFGAVLGVALAQELEQTVQERKKTEKKTAAGSCWTALLSGGMIQCVTLPVSLWFYYELSPYSVVLNLIVIPLVSMILGGGLLSMVLGIVVSGCLFPVAGIPAGGTYLLLEFYEWLGGITQKLPWSFVLVGRPEVWQIVGYYIMFGVTVWAILHWAAVYKNLQHIFEWCGEWKNKEKQKPRSRTDSSKVQDGKERKLLLAGTVLALSFLFLPESNSMELLFLDVSQGDGALIYTESGKVILSDCGSSDVTAIGEYRLSPVLKQEGSALIDLAVVSHTDSDHISGIKELLEAMPVYEGRSHFIRNYSGAIGIVELLLPKVSEPSEAYLELEALAHAKNVALRYAEAGEVLYQEQGLLLECLSPEKAEESENETSLVFLLQSPELVVWFMGDAGTASEENIMERLDQVNMEAVTDGKMTVLKVGHHGSKTSSGEEFLSFVKPDIAVISCGYGNSYGHPHASVLERLKEAGSRVMATMEYGAVRITVEEEILVEGYKSIIESAGR
ncbi:MAG: DNA internalization-related competence protein ComEC/Rec2 [Lachnospiraceae bacterium]|nr:DNA internalization-related competence protein ComEC/Rec2 [Lachnospiraceae bacterium]